MRTEKKQPPKKRRAGKRAFRERPIFRNRSKRIRRKDKKRRKRTSILVVFRNHFGESSECEKHADDRHDLRQIKEEYAFQGIFGPVPKLSDEQDRCERRDSKVSNESVDFYERGPRDIENDEVRETEKRVNKGQRNDRGRIRIRAFRIGIGYSERKVRRFAVNLSADERSEISDDSREEERENDGIQIFSKSELVFFQTKREHEKKPERASREREVIVGSEEKPKKTVGNHVPPFRKKEEQPGKYERGKEEGERVSDKEVRVDSEFSGKLVEHSEKQEERYGERDTESIYGNSEGKFDLRVHAGF